MKINIIVNFVFYFSLLIGNAYWIIKVRNFAENIIYKDGQIDLLKSSISSINYGNELQFEIENHRINMNLNIKNEKGEFTKLSSIHESNKKILIISSTLTD